MRVYQLTVYFTDKMKRTQWFTSRQQVSELLKALRSTGMDYVLNEFKFVKSIDCSPGFAKGECHGK